MSEPEFVDPKQIRQGPICHESLSPELLEQIEAVYGVIGPYIGTTLEQFEIGVMRDLQLEIEAAIWCSITAAWLAYHENYLNDETLPDEQERELIGALIAISTGIEDVTKLNVSEKVGRRLIRCYDDPAGG